VKQLSIGIDGYNLAMPHGTGIATYGMTLARTLLQNGHDIDGVFGVDVGGDPSMREVLFFDRIGRAPPERTTVQRRSDARRRNRITLNPFFSPRAQEIPISGRVQRDTFAERIPNFSRLLNSPRLYEYAHRYFHNYGRFLRLKISNPPDIMHWTYPIPVRIAGATNLYTIHDLVPLKLPYTTLDNKAAYRKLIGSCTKYGDHICTVSDASRNDIIADLGVSPDHVTNAYQASPLPDDFLETSKEEDSAIIEGIFGLQPQGYFLFFGAVEPKKNLGRLLESYLALQTETPLVLVGGREWQSERELTLLKSVGSPEADSRRRLAERVVRLDHLARPLLLRLIRSARAVLFPSIYEGFGLPVLEAMQLGTPVLTSNISSLPEIAGGAAMLVDPYDTRSIAHGIKALDTDTSLRARLSAAGLARAEFFSQARYGARLEDMYSRILASRT
jgi:glycosyltransferase involved in cell wall biosynthesis